MFGIHESKEKWRKEKKESLIPDRPTGRPGLAEYKSGKQKEIESDEFFREFDELEKDSLRVKPLFAFVVLMSWMEGREEWVS